MKQPDILKCRHFIKDGKCLKCFVFKKSPEKILRDSIFNQYVDNLVKSSNVPYYQRDHTHCQDQETPACGIDKHTQCCLCGLQVKNKKV